MRRLAFVAALALCPSLAGAQALGCPDYVTMPEPQRVILTQGMLSGYLLAAMIVRERSLDLVNDAELGPGLRAAASEVSRPLTRLQGKTPRDLAEGLRVECGTAQSMANDVSAAFISMLRRPPAPRQGKPGK